MKRMMATCLTGLCVVVVAAAFGNALWTHFCCRRHSRQSQRSVMDARAAVAQMGKTLLAKEFSFRARDYPALRDWRTGRCCISSTSSRSRCAGRIGC